MWFRVQGMSFPKGNSKESPPHLSQFSNESILCVFALYSIATALSTHPCVSSCLGFKRRLTICLENSYIENYIFFIYRAIIYSCNLFRNCDIFKYLWSIKRSMMHPDTSVFVIIGGLKSKRYRLTSGRIPILEIKRLISRMDTSKIVSLCWNRTLGFLFIMLWYLLICPWAIRLRVQFNHFHTHINDRYLDSVECHKTSLVIVNFGLCNGVLPGRM